MLKYPVFSIKPEINGSGTKFWSSGSKVVSIPNFAFGGGKRGTMVANTSEYYVPNYKGGGDAIFNRDMVKTMGLPSGAKKINAANGYIPNFADISRMSLSAITRRLGAQEMQAPTSRKLRNEKAELLTRKRRLQKGEMLTIDRDNDKNPVVALREIAAETIDKT